MLKFTSEKERWRYKRCLHIRSRAKLAGIKFNLTPQDIPTPDTCPVLGVPLSYDSFEGHQPTVDRTIPHLGYVKGNIDTISARANTLKSDACIEELACIILYLARR